MSCDVQTVKYIQCALPEQPHVLTSQPQMLILATSLMWRQSKFPFSTLNMCRGPQFSQPSISGFPISTRPLIRPAPTVRYSKSVHSNSIPTAFKMMTSSSKCFTSDLQLFSLTSHHTLSLQLYPARPFFTSHSLYVGMPFSPNLPLKNASSAKTLISSHQSFPVFLQHGLCSSTQNLFRSGLLDSSVITFRSLMSSF